MVTNLGRDEDQSIPTIKRYILFRFEAWQAYSWVSARTIRSVAVTGCFSTFRLPPAE
jgi:hypothetical protein